MKKSRKTNYHIQQRNQHLKNVLEESYYLELGVIDVKVLERIFNYEVVSIEDIVYNDIVVEGTGQIVGNIKEELELQFAYLDSLRSKSTSHKIFLTLGLLRYEIQNQGERYAPIVLVPIDMDIQNNTIVMSSEPIANTLVINDLQATLAIDISPLPKDASVYDVHLFCDQVNRKTGFMYTATNYLTVVAVEYNDNSFNFDELSVQRSIYEKTSYDVYQSYFASIKAIKPTNIYQKWALLKIDNGESFFVDGKLGTGKTYTIINAIADAISPYKQKKVLYVSQDRNNLNKVYKELDDLHLSPYVYNLCRNISYNDEPKLSFENIREEKIGIETLFPISEYEQALNASIHRCRYANIITELASIKNTNPDIEAIPVDAYLENNEIKDVYSDLKEIENILDVIEPLDTNLWSKIEQYYSKQHTDEIVHATDAYLAANAKFNKAIKEYCKKYEIKLPDSFNSAQKLLGYIGTFKKLLPPSCWVDKFDVDKINEILKAIEFYQQEYGEIKNLLNQKVHDDYQPGIMKKLFEDICYKHLTEINKDEINLILSSNDDLKKTIDVIDKAKRDINNSVNNLKKIFSLAKVSIPELEYMRKVVGLLSYNTIHNTWIELYLQRSNIKQHYLEIASILDKYLAIKKYLSTFLIKENSLSYRGLKQVTTSKEYVKQFMLLFDRKALRKARVSQENVIASIFDMIDAGDKIKEIAERNSLSYGNDLDLFIVNYDNWLIFINSLSNDELTLFKYQLSRSKQSFITTKPLFDAYNLFQTSEKTLIKRYQDIKRFGINIEGDTILDKNAASHEWVDYLKRLVIVNDEIHSFFKLSKVTIDDLLLVIKKDQEYAKLLQVLKKRDLEIKEYLGNIYDGLNTNVSLVHLLQKHFAKFVAMLQDKDVIAKLFENDLLKHLINDYDALNLKAEKNLECHHVFSKYFVGGQGHLLECSLDQAYRALIRFDDHKSEIRYVFTIFDYAHHFEKLGLVNLAEGIISSKYKQGISTQFIYSIYSEYKLELINERPILAESSNILTWLQNYRYFETNYCKTNLRDLERYCPQIDKRLTNHIASMLFNDYDRLVLELIDHKSVFLADVNIFNSPIDLSKFDVIFVDDVHLASGFKYTRMDEVKQIVFFGDSTAKIVRTNNIFHSVPLKNVFRLVESYCIDNPAYGNIPSQYNQYILSFPKPERFVLNNSIDEIAQEIVETYLKDRNKKINIIISTNNYKLEINKAIVKQLFANLEKEDVIPTVKKNFNIVRVPYENNNICDDVFFLFDDLAELDEKRQRYIFSFYSSGAKAIHFMYTNDCAIKDVKEYVKTTIGEVMLPTKQMSRLTRIVYEELKIRGFNVESGPGRIDLMIKGKTTKTKVTIPNVGIIIEGLDGKSSYAILDEYDYYYNEYHANGWEMYIFCVSDIIDHLQEKLDIISSFLAQKDIKSVHQLKIDEFM